MKRKAEARENEEEQAILGRDFAATLFQFDSGGMTFVGSCLTTSNS